MRQPEEQERIDRVQVAVEELKTVVGVRNAWIDDFDMHAYGFNVDILLNYSHCSGHRFFLPVNLRKVSAQCGAIVAYCNTDADHRENNKLIWLE